MEGDWVDFRVIKAAVTIGMVLDRYEVVLKKIGHELRGKCPIHRGTNNKHFTVNTSKSVFKCFFPQCGAHGNVLDFVAAMEQCSVREAAVKLRDWFKVGDSSLQSNNESVPEFKLERGIYSDGKDRVYEVIGVASHAERLEWWVVYRELFGEYRYLVIPIDGFLATLGPSSPNALMLIKSPL